MASRNCACAGGIVFLVGGEHDQEEAIFRCRGETRNVEYRVIRHGQAVQREHAEDGRDAGEQNRHLKRDDDERGPGVVRLAADVQRVVDGGHPVLHQVAGEAADDAADQRRPAEPRRDGIRSLRPGLRRGTDCRRRSFCSRLDAWCGRRRPEPARSRTPPSCRRWDRASYCEPRPTIAPRAISRESERTALADHSFTSASGRRVRISKIEIAGSMRRNRNMAA